MKDGFSMGRFKGRIGHAAFSGRLVEGYLSVLELLHQIVVHCTEAHGQVNFCPFIIPKRGKLSKVVVLLIVSLSEVELYRH